MKWICKGCHHQPSHAGREHCPLCTGFTTRRNVALKRQIRNYEIRMKQRRAA